MRPLLLHFAFGLFVGACGRSELAPEWPTDTENDTSSPADSSADIADALDSPTDFATPTDDGLLFDAESESPTITPTPPPDFAWYILNETSGLIAHDATANHYDIPLSGVTWAAGANFDGATDCGEVSVDSSFRQPPVTLSAWLTAAARDDYNSNAYGLTPYPPNAFSGDVPGSGGYGIGENVWVSSAATGAAIGIETGVGFTTGFNSINGFFLVNAEYLVVVTEDSASASLYVNGVLFTPTPANEPPIVTPTPLHLGCHNDDAGYGTKRFFKGTIRDARIYKRLLAADEIAQLYLNGPTTTTP